jgi:hypothetical protein
MALRERYQSENTNNNSRQRAPTLYTLLQHAKNEKWITNEGFPSIYERAKCLAEQKKMLSKMKTHDFEKEPYMNIEEADKDEILESLEKLDMVEAITKNAHKIRNDLAHGSSTLHPNSISTLKSISEIINQIYP